MTSKQTPRSALTSFPDAASYLRLSPIAQALHCGAKSRAPAWPDAAACIATQGLARVCNGALDGADLAPEWLLRHGVRGVSCQCCRGFGVTWWGHGEGGNEWGRGASRTHTCKSVVPDLPAGMLADRRTVAEWCRSKRRLADVTRDARSIVSRYLRLRASREAPHERPSWNLNSSAWIVCRLHSTEDCGYLESAGRLLTAQIQRLAAVA